MHPVSKPQNFLLPVQVKNRQVNVIDRFVSSQKLVSQYLCIDVYLGEKESPTQWNLVMKAYNPLLLPDSRLTRSAKTLRNTQVLMVQCIENHIFQNALTFLHNTSIEIDRGFSI